MPMSRADLIAYLASEFKKYHAAAGLLASDTEDHYKGVIDKTFQKLFGTSHNSLAVATVPEGKELHAKLVASVYFLHRMARFFGTQPSYNVAGAGVSENYGNLLRQTLDLLEEARAEAKAEGIVIALAGNQKGVKKHKLRIGIYER